MIPIDEEDEEIGDESSQGIKTDTTFMENASENKEEEESHAEEERKSDDQKQV